MVNVPVGVSEPGIGIRGWTSSSVFMVGPGGFVGFKSPANMIVDTKDKQIRMVKVFMILPFQREG